MARRDGSNFPVQMDLVSVRGDDGNILYRVATAQDISERKKAEKEIAEQANILAQVNDAVISTDENFIIKSWNAAAERMYRWKEEEVMGILADKILQTEFPGGTREEAVRQIKHSGLAGAGAQGDMIEAHRKRIFERERAAEAHAAEQLKLLSTL